jgi:hypothetical protein
MARELSIYYSQPDITRSRPEACMLLAVAKGGEGRPRPWEVGPASATEPWRDGTAHLGATLAFCPGISDV